MRIKRFDHVIALDEFMQTLKDEQYIDLKVSLGDYEELYILVYKEV